MTDIANFYRLLAVGVATVVLVGCVLLARPASRGAGRLRDAVELVIIRGGPALSPLLLILGEFTGLGDYAVVHDLRGRFSAATAVAAAVGGGSLLIWARTTLGRYFDPRLHIRPEHVLITAGPYAYVRHPVYSAYLLLWVSLALLFANVAFSAFVGFFLARTLLRIPAEERMMSEHFGDEYVVYRKSVPALIPSTRSRAT
ncbi:MAG: isoprenylcysteine carboxylmethyltransferase family protein [Acidobacteriota bacterium]|nr:isoprenylcysteine carboxylmethyltransferase family protein [Acidobacteriota bacterium]